MVFVLSPTFYDYVDGFLAIGLFTGGFFTARGSEESSREAVWFIRNSDEHVKKIYEVIRND